MDFGNSHNMGAIGEAGQAQQPLVTKVNQPNQEYLKKGDPALRETSSDDLIDRQIISVSQSEKEIQEDVLQIILNKSLLTILLKSAHDLSDVEAFSKSDAFAEIQFQGPKMRTEFVPNNFSPKWNQKFHFVVGGPSAAADLKQIINIIVYDHEMMLSNKPIGQFQISLSDLLSHNGSDFEVPLAPPPTPGKAGEIKTKFYGMIRFSYTLKKLHSQSEALGGEHMPLNQPERVVLLQNQIESRYRPFKKVLPTLNSTQRGVLTFHVHNVLNLEEDSNYELDYIVQGSATSTKIFKDRSEKIKPPMQFQKPFYLPFEGEILTSEATFILAKRHIYGRKVIGKFTITFKQAYELLAPNTAPLSIIIDNFTPEPDAQAKSIDRPKPFMIATLSYANSLFTQMSAGELFLKVNSWNFNGAAFPSNLYLQLKITSSGDQKSCKRLYNQQIFKLTEDNMLDIITITVAEDRAVALDPKIMSTQVRVFELFTGNEIMGGNNILYQNSFHQVEFHDVEKQTDVLLTLASKFTPKALTLEQKAQLKQVHDDWQQHHKSGIISTNEGQGMELDVKRMMPEYRDTILSTEGQNDENNISGSTNQDELLGTQKQQMIDELASLNVPNCPIFTEDPRGILIIRLKKIFKEVLKKAETQTQGASFADLTMVQIQKLETAKNEVQPLDRIYFIFRTSRMTLRTKSVRADLKSRAENSLFDDLITLKIGDKHEIIEIKLMKKISNRSDEIISECKLVIKDVIDQGWKTVTKDLLFERKNARGLPKDIVQVDMQYRVSKFTKIPRGKIELILVKGTDLRYKSEGYSPVMEFRIGNMRMMIDEQVIPMKATWKQRVIELETASQWDSLEIRFYNDRELGAAETAFALAHSEQRKVSVLNILGAYHRALSSIYFDDDNSSTFDIDLHQLNEQMHGKIKVQFEYYPNREGSEYITRPEDFDGRQGESVIQSEAGNNAQRKQNDGVKYDTKQGVAYMTLMQMQVLGVPPNHSYNVENIRLELTYGKQKCFSKISTDLSKTNNKETINDNFRFVIEDTSLSRGAPEQKIQIQAFDIDYSVDSSNDQLAHLFVGECSINTIFLRQYQSEVLHYECSLPIAETHFLKRVSLDQQEDLLQNAILEKKGTEAMNEMLANMRKLLKDEDLAKQQFGEEGSDARGQLQAPELKLSFQIFYISTNFTRQPIGLMTLNEMALLNLSNFIPDYILKEKANNTGGVFLEFKLNKNKNLSETGYLHTPIDKDVTSTVNKEQVCLFSQEYNPIDVIRIGKVHYVRNSSLHAHSYFKWERQIVLHTCSPDDELEIRIIWELPQRDPDAASRGITTKIVVGSANLNLSDVSFFCPDRAPSTHETSIAMLLDFQMSDSLLNTLNIGTNPGQPTMGINRQMDTLQTLKSHLGAGSKDLASRIYQKQLVFLADFKFSPNDQFEDCLKLQGLQRSNNMYMMPVEVAYNDFLNNQFQQLLKQKQAPASSSITNQEQLTSNDRRHILIEVDIKNFNSILRAINIGKSLYCFNAIEPLQQQDSVKTYVQSVLTQIAAAHNAEKLNRFNSQNSITNDLIVKQRDTIRKLKAMGYSSGLMEGEMMALPEDLVKPDTQISSEVYPISDFEVHQVNNKLEIWVPNDTQRVMLSLVVQMDGGCEEIEKFRQLVLQHGLSRQQTLLGVHRLASSGLLSSLNSLVTSPASSPIKQKKQSFSDQGGGGGVSETIQITRLNNVCLYQALIDLDPGNTLPKDPATPSYLSSKQIFIQSCNLAELALIGQDNHLLSTPQSLAQAFVRTTIHTSKFIDTPSGILNIVLKNLGHTSPTFQRENYFIRIALSSRIPRDRILAYSGSQIQESYDTQTLDFYLQKPPRSASSKKTLVHLNEARNFLLRHYSDQLVISLHHKTSSNPEQTQCTLRTKLELNNLDLNKEKICIQVIGTQPMQKKSPNVLVYFNFELELLFKPAASTDKEADEFEIALQNYKMMKQDKNQQGDGKVTKSEIAFIKMLLARIKDGQRIKKLIRFRKAVFQIRHMLKTRYQSLCQSKKEAKHLALRVNPKSFMMGASYGSSSKPADFNSEKAIQQREILLEVKNELLKGLGDKASIVASAISSSKYSDILLEKGSRVEKNNVLIVDFLDTISAVSNPLQTQALSPNVSLLQPPSLSSKYKKIVFVATQDSQTVFKTEFENLANISTINDLLKNLRVAYKNVNNEQTLSFRLLASPRIMQQTSIVQESNNMITIGTSQIRIGQLGLKTWNPHEMSFAFLDNMSALQQANRGPMRLRLQLLYSEFTRNPSKVVNVNFHRILRIKNSEFQNESQQMTSTLPGDKKLDHSKIILQEQPIYERINESLANNIASMLKPTQQKAGGIQSAESSTGIQNYGAVTVRMEFDNCVENEGPLLGGDCREYEINCYGKPNQLIDKNLNRLTINNIKYDAQVAFKICIGGSQILSKSRGMNKAGTEIAVAQFYLAEVQSSPMQQVNFFIPLRMLTKSEDDISSSWARRQYNFWQNASSGEDNLYVLASICITDKTFGELSFNFDRLHSIPRSLSLRWLQWKVTLVKAQDLQKYKQNGSLEGDAGKGNGPIFCYQSERMEYDITCCKEVDLKTDSEVNVHLQMKDIFNENSNDDMLNSRVTLSNSDQDTYIVMELLGYDDSNQVEYVLGENQLSLLSLIQLQISEAAAASVGNQQRSLASSPSRRVPIQGAQRGYGIQNEKILENTAEKKVENEFAGCSNRFQELFKSSYVRFNKTKEELAQKKAALQPAQASSGLEKKVEDAGPSIRLAQGQKQYFLKVPEYIMRGGALLADAKTRDELDKMANKAVTRMALPDEMGEGSSSLSLVSKIEFNFSYKKRTQFSKEQLEAQEEAKQIERIRQQKNISNILDTLRAVIPEVKQSALLYKNLKRLGFVLAVHTPNEVNQNLDEIEDDDQAMDSGHDQRSSALTNLEKIIQTMRDVLKGSSQSNRSMSGGPDMGVFIEVMHILTYLKIICSQTVAQQHQKSLERYKESIQKECLIEALIEAYQTDSFGSLRSPTFTIEFFSFLATQLSDFPQLYFSSLSGVRLEKIINDIDKVDQSNFHIVLAYAKFLDTLAQCLIVRKEPAATDEKSASIAPVFSDVQIKLLKMDTGKIIRAVKNLIQNILDGNLEVYNNAHETVTSSLSSTALQIVHELIIFSNAESKAQLIADEDRKYVAPLLQSLLRVLIDSIVSGGTSSEFIDELKNRIAYEVKMIEKFKAESHLMLTFDSAILLGLYKKLLETYQKLQVQHQIQSTNITQQQFRYFDRLRHILEFFATATGSDTNTSLFTMNAFGENNRELIGEVIRTAKALAIDQDFIIFLENVVKADAEIESDMEGTKAGFKDAQDRRLNFFVEKYGDKNAKTTPGFNEMKNLMNSAKKFSLSRIEWLDNIYETQ